MCDDGLRVLNKQLEEHLKDEQAAEDYVSFSEYEDNGAATLSLHSYHIEQLQPETTADRGLPMRNDVITPDTVTIHVGGLKALGGSEVSYAAMLIEILSKVISNDIVVERYKRQSSMESPNESQLSEMELQQLSDYLRLEVEAREKSGPQETCTATKNLLDTVTIHVRGLKTLGRLEVSYAAVLLEILTKVIPSDIVVERYNKRQSSMEGPNETQLSETELQQLSDHLQLEVEAREKSGQQETCVRDTPEERRDMRPRFDSPPMPTEPTPKIAEYRTTRVPFGTPASPFLFTATLQYYFNHVDSARRSTAMTLAENFYVDDLVAGVSSSNEAFRRYKEVNLILSRAGTKLQKRSTNNDELRRPITNGLDFGSAAPLIKVLGSLWDTTTDKLVLKMESLLELLDERKDTKRCVLQTTTRFFDPLAGYHHSSLL
ncbi:hypothetical protein HPB52_021733 [Rhipicephalus sanguineus]|uniref:Uncharacterized protein n=1 Tax=Rhipicephalus sanguineus TaxID=34632 RepID=A0A9D4T366_RHISA|nr:hypothetical protein HPB52_021733 [Rhipicephalus sanguineus]